MTKNDQCHLGCFIHDLELLKKTYTEQVHAESVELRALLNDFYDSIADLKGRAEELAALKDLSREQMANCCHTRREAVTQ